ncbi:uncharacterized protein CTRU02_207028 [Colletotrichum truncatum]|uniref:Uncharacterized protein n=1 Tax=Colletotrichum truncatum TaxID=5467 RepID=A0ACC3YZJ6_COLTU|nr:uncharacterized protein CTRU02_11116 [Colletotrichum truncatum]KAF6786245.1 hypothetical protein CTRU02_11116 [Colletotrichum truncatum]
MSLRYFVFSLIALCNVNGVVLSANSADALPVSWCITYLSTYLEPVRTVAANPAPTNLLDDANSSTGGLVPTSPNLSLLTFPTSRSANSNSPATTELSSTQFLSASTPLPSSAASSSLTTSAFNSTPSGPALQPVIFLIVPAIRSTKRNIDKRAFGGFLNHDISTNRQTCDSASTFILTNGQLLDEGVPVHYTAGETFKLLRTTEPPLGSSVTTTFENVGGTLRFSSPLLPNGQAEFCQDVSGRVYITFTSRPPDCVPVSLVTYGGTVYAQSQLDAPTGDANLP